MCRLEMQEADEAKEAKEAKEGEERETIAGVGGCRKLSIRKWDVLCFVRVT